MPGSVEFTSRPWQKYHRGLAALGEPRYSTAIELIRCGLTTFGERPAVWYFDTPISGNEIAAAADALAVELRAGGISTGDRIVLQLQNMPSALIGLAAAWRLGAIAVWANPMYRQRELRHIVSDSGARAIIGLAEQWKEVVAPAIAGTDVHLQVCTSGDEYGATGTVPTAPVTPADALELSEIVARRRGDSPPPISVNPDDVAALVYTSGTTGPPKGSMTLHRNLCFIARIWQRWADLGPDDCLFGLAPIFHITGLVCNLVLPLHLAAPVVMSYRFAPRDALRLIADRHCTFSVGAITAFTAMMNDPAFAGTDLSNFRKVYSGGAPVAPAIVDRWEQASGTYIRNCYGMTESTTATHCTPQGERAPVDPTSGALSVGVPTTDTDAKILDDDGVPLPPGEIGQVIMAGPQISGGYWGKPEETARTFTDGWLHSGDVGFMDDNGWFYIVDRQKDLIIASGYKVWPREVEDVLAEHEAVREAAVIGVPDEYRGEAPRAFVSLRPNAHVTATGLEEFCRERLAAYKVPRQFEIMPELPKTVSGKILRRELRGR